MCVFSVFCTGHTPDSEGSVRSALRNKISSATCRAPWLRRAVSSRPAEAVPVAAAYTAGTDGQLWPQGTGDSEYSGFYQEG